MQKYKAGQVAAALFSNNKKDTPKSSSALAKLFSVDATSKTENAFTSSKIEQSSSSIKTTPKMHQKKKKLSPPLHKIEPPLKSSETPRKSKKKSKKEKASSEKTKSLQPGRPQQEDSTPAKLKKRKKETKSDVNKSVSTGKEKSGKSDDVRKKGSPSKKQPDASPEISQSQTTQRKRKHEDSTREDGTEKRPRRDRQRDKTADNRTVFVGNCPLSADKKVLKALFKSYGKIETIRFRCAPPADPNLPRRAIVITKNFHEQCDTYVAYIVFQEEAAAKKALEKNGYLLENMHLRVDLASGSKKHDKKRSIFVGNLPFTAKEEEIRNHFEDCGDIVNVRIIRDRQTSLGKGICYVQFDSKDAVSLALKLNASKYQGRPLRVMGCVSKPKKKDEVKAGKSNTKIKAKPEKKKPSFAPSNLSSTSFKAKLKTKKEKRLRKIKKKKEASKKGDGLSAIFGDIPAAKKVVKKPKKGQSGAKGKPLTSGGKKQGKRQSMGKKFSQKGSSFKGKGKGGKR